MTSRDERRARVDFSQRYAVPPRKVLEEIERRVLGDVWGVNGYTTVPQAEALGRALRLDAGQRLLDVGTGRGYPAMYLAATTGCSVIATDMPFEPLSTAARQAAPDLADRVSFVSAGGAAQPFRDEVFDAVVLTDVLC